MRVGIFGGTFDPPHVGHLLLASDAYEALALDRVVFVPNARQPLKAADAVSAPRHRLAMIRLATAGDARFDVDAVEVERGGVSYTVDTLEALARRSPREERFFLVGADMAETFARWREPRRIAELATLAVLQRSGEDRRPERVREAIRAVTGPGAPEPVFVETRRVDISSTEIRSRVGTGRPLTGFVPPLVAAYIGEHGLYQPRHE